MPPTPPCPPWCGNPDPNHPAHHEAVFGQYGDPTGTTTAVTVTQHDDQEPALTVWSHAFPGDYGYVELTPADAVVLARALTAVPPEDIIRFAYALTNAAALLGFQPAADPSPA